MKKYTVYCHTNLKNGKKYIGITCQDVKRRWRNGRGYDEHMPFGRAIAKYGYVLKHIKNSVTEKCYIPKSVTGFCYIVTFLLLTLKQRKRP